MPKGKAKKPAGGYRAGAKGSYGCDGYPTVSADGTVHGCHPTKAKASAQARAIWASTSQKSMNVNVDYFAKAMFAEGDFVIVSADDEIYVGRVEHVMLEGASGLPGSEYYLETSPENPGLVVRTLEFESDGQYWEETVYLVSVAAEDATKIAPLPLDAEALMVDGQLVPEPDTMPTMGKAYEGCGCPTCKELNVNCENCPVCKAEAMKSQDCCGNIEKEAPCWDGYVQRGMKEKDGRMVPNCVPAEKAAEMDAEKREFSTTSRERMAESGAAMPDGSFPIASRSDLMNAIRSVGRAKNYEAAKQHIIRRARALNAMDMLPEDWKNKATKGVGQWAGSIFDLNPFVK